VDEVAKPLSIIFQMLWQSSEVSKDWKRGNITPNFKKSRELQEIQSLICTWQHHGADPSGNYGKSHKKTKKNKTKRK